MDRFDRFTRASHSSMAVEALLIGGQWVEAASARRSKATTRPPDSSLPLWPGATAWTSIVGLPTCVQPMEQVQAL